MDNNELGKFKDELGGLLIEEAIFLGIKQYGYKYVDALAGGGKQIEKSTFAGVPKNSLPFKDIEYLAEGGTIERDNITRFYKSIQTLEIKVKDTKMEIKANADKPLIGNNYIPLHVNLIDILEQENDLDETIPNNNTNYLEGTQTPTLSAGTAEDSTLIESLNTPLGRKCFNSKVKNMNNQINTYKQAIKVFK